MAVKKTKPKWTVEDGYEFDNEEDAKRHEKIMEARQGFETAKEKLGRVLAETQKTADGLPFEFGVMKTYFHITTGWGGLPNLKRVTFFYCNSDFTFDSRGDEIDLLALVIYDHTLHNQTRTEYRVRDLYACEPSARAALLEAQEKWLAERIDEVNALRKELDKPPL